MLLPAPLGSFPRSVTRPQRSPRPAGVSTSPGWARHAAMHEFLSICAQDGSHHNAAGATTAYSHRVCNIVDAAGGICAAPVAGQPGTQFKATMDALGSMRPAESIPVYVMLPLDTVGCLGVTPGVCNPVSSGLMLLQHPSAACTQAEPDQPIGKVVSTS
jgi:hypothetical protein